MYDDWKEYKKAARLRIAFWFSPILGGTVRHLSGVFSHLSSSPGWDCSTIYCSTNPKRELGCCCSSYFSWLHLVTMVCRKRWKYEIGAQLIWIDSVADFKQSQCTVSETIKEICQELLKCCQRIVLNWCLVLIKLNSTTIGNHFQLWRAEFSMG